MWYFKKQWDVPAPQPRPVRAVLRRRVVVRVAAVGLAASLISACGFHLRSSQSFAFETLSVTPEKNGLLAADLIRYFGSGVMPLPTSPQQPQPQVIVDVLQDAREKNVVGVNASGQVREFQLRIRLKFRMRTPDGRELIAPTELVQQRDISFNESAVLAKEAEEVLLFRDMQADLLQQVLRRLAAVKSLQAP